jgi:two-component system CheB/CheR fusion protein
VQSLARPIRACLAGESESESVTLEAINRRGKPIVCDVTCTPMRRADGSSIRGVILVMEESAPRAASVGA